MYCGIVFKKQVKTKCAVAGNIMPKVKSLPAISSELSLKHELKHEKF